MAVRDAPQASQLPLPLRVAAAALPPPLALPHSDIAEVAACCRAAPNADVADPLLGRRQGKQTAWE